MPADGGEECHEPLENETILENEANPSRRRFRSKLEFKVFNAHFEWMNKTPFSSRWRKVIAWIRMEILRMNVPAMDITLTMYYGGLYVDRVRTNWQICVKLNVKRCHIGDDKETGDVILGAFGSNWSTWRKLMWTYEQLQYVSTSGGCGKTRYYVDTWLKIKQEASGWSAK